MRARILATSVVAVGLLIPELRRLAKKYGVIFSAAVGGCAVLLVSGWLLALVLTASGLTGIFSTLRSWQLALTIILPLSAFLFARRYYSVTPSLFPSGIVLAAVSMVFGGIDFSYAY
jgi:hypothetical protein